MHQQGSLHVVVSCTSLGMRSAMMNHACMSGPSHRSDATHQAGIDWSTLLWAYAVALLQDSPKPCRVLNRTPYGTDQMGRDMIVTRQAGPVQMPAEEGITRRYRPGTLKATRFLPVLNSMSAAAVTPADHARF